MNRTERRSLAAPRSENFLKQSLQAAGGTEQIRNKDVFGAIWDKMYREINPAFLLVGYGATRRVESAAAKDIGTS
jgi:hypothetical protein